MEWHERLVTPTKTWCVCGGDSFEGRCWFKGLLLHDVGWVPEAWFCSSHALWLSFDFGVCEHKLVLPDDVKGSF